MKRYLYLWHRWLGIGLCLLMALWFWSGMVMLYVGYPKLTPSEHLARLPALALEDCCVEPQALLATSTAQQLSLRLTTVAGEPRYLLGEGGRVRAFDARSGQPIGAVDAQQALASAQQFAPGVAVEYQRQAGEDTWTHSRSLDGDRPLHRLRIDDPQQRLLYVSSATGAVVRDATLQERIWNWSGAWLHWLYPLRGNLLDPAWRDTVIYLSLAASVMALLGMLIGVLRWRFSKPYRSGSRSPYRKGWARWHHIGGLLFGVALLCWIVSGLMSMRPWGLLAGQSAFSAANYQGGNLQQAEYGLSLTESWQRLTDSGFEPRELEWRMLGGQVWLVGYDAIGNSQLLALHPQAVVQSMHSLELLQGAAAAALPANEWAAEWLTDYDFYYLDRAEQSMYGGRQRPLPALRIRFDDPAATWVHLDPYNGSLIELLDRPRRANRWLFNLLHSWDLPWLLQRPLLREALLIGFSLGGMLISLSGVVLGWRRLRGAPGRR